MLEHDEQATTRARGITLANNTTAEEPTIRVVIDERTALCDRPALYTRVQQSVANDN